MSRPPKSANPASSLGPMSKEHALRTAVWVAEFLNVTREWVDEATASGALPSIRVGDAVRFDPAVIKAWGRAERLAARVPESGVPGPVLAVLDEIRQALSARDEPVPANAPAVTIKEAMRRLGCGRVTVFKLLKSGALEKAARVGRKTLITAESIDRVLRAPSQPPARGRAVRKPTSPTGWRPMDVRRLRA